MLTPLNYALLGGRAGRLHALGRNLMEHEHGESRQSVTLADLTALNEELAALARARVPLESQLRRLGRELPGISGQLAERIGQRMEAGASLSDALAAEGNRVPEVYRAVVDAGTRCGRLPAALEAIVDSGARLEQLRRATGVALLYPLMVIAITWTLVIFASAMIVPKFGWFEGPNGGPFTRSLEIPQMVAVAAIGLTTGVLLLLLAWWWRTGRNASASGAGLWSLVPWLGRVQRFASVATFAELLRLMVEQDTPLDEALEICARATGDRRLGDAARDLASQIAAGSMTTEAGAMRFPPLVALALRHADNRPLMVSSLAQAETLYRERANLAAAGATEYLPIVLVAGLGGTAVAALAGVVLWPYFSMLHTVSSPIW